MWKIYKGDPSHLQITDGTETVCIGCDFKLSGEDSRNWNKAVFSDIPFIAKSISKKKIYNLEYVKRLINDLIEEQKNEHN